MTEPPACETRCMASMWRRKPRFGVSYRWCNGYKPGRRRNAVDTVTVNIPEAEITAEVDRILVSKGFANAGRLSRLLRYVVEKTLAGEADQLKEYVVGVEVFDRDEKYDPRLDSIVRVEAGRLRSRLDEYYNGEGAASPLRISLPRGGYVAQFEPRVEAPLQSSPTFAPDRRLGPLAADRGADLRRGRHGRVARRLESHASSIGTVGGRPRLHAVDAGIRGCRAGITHDRDRDHRAGTIGNGGCGVLHQRDAVRRPAEADSAKSPRCSMRPSSWKHRSNANQPGCWCRYEL